MNEFVNFISTNNYINLQNKKRIFYFEKKTKKKLARQQIE